MKFWQLKIFHVQKRTLSAIINHFIEHCYASEKKIEGTVIKSKHFHANDPKSASRIDMREKNPI